MAVYERTYRAYRGSLTAPRWRFLILPRYALATLFGSRLFLAFFVLCFVWPLVLSILIYLRHNAEALGIFGVTPEQVAEQFKVGAYAARNFFQAPHGGLAFVMALVVGPALIAPDLRNNAMPLYLSRPFTRSEYVLGKLVVLFFLLSLVTWVPGLVLFVFQAFLEPGWLAEGWRLGAALFVGSWVWILLLSFLSLALSALVKWKPLARVVFLGLYSILFGLSAVVNALFRTEWGSLLHLGALRDTVWDSLYGLPVRSGLPVAAAWVGVAAVLGLCLLILSRRVRAYEVVKS
jgi:ABC-2 type transport system permease protein